MILYIYRYLAELELDIVRAVGVVGVEFDADVVAVLVARLHER